MARWMIQTAESLKPIFDRLHQMQIACKTMLIDETYIQVLKEAGRKASTKSFLIAKVREGPPGERIVLFHYNASRALEVIDKITEGYSGILLSDGLRVYDSLAAKRPQLVHCGCWSHARRRFIDAQKVLKPQNRHSSLATAALKMIDQLYQIESSIKDHDSISRRDIRNEKSIPILNSLEKWINESIDQVPRKTQIGQAIHYLADQWPKLIRFTKHPEIPIHNNATEREIRTVAVGRKNFLFCNSVKGANASAVLYSLIATAKMNKINPYKYLITALNGIANKEEIKNLLPFS